MTMDTESRNQSICRKLVDREIGECVSSLVSHFAGHPEALDESEYTWEENVLSLCVSSDWEEPARDEGWIPVSEWGGKFLGSHEGAEFLKIEDGKIADCSHADDWQELCNDESIDPDESEVLEHWIVSGWFAGKLAEYGECTGELFGLTIWGRGCSGQAICMDGVIREIASEMEILAGQANEWEV